MSIKLSAAHAVEGVPTRELRYIPELFFYLEKPVVLGDSFCSRRSAGLDLAGIYSNHEISDCGVFRLT